jgi:hypothetical protein
MASIMDILLKGGKAAGKGLVTLRLPNGTTKTFTDPVKAAAALREGAKPVSQAPIRVAPTPKQSAEDMVGGISRILSRGTTPISQIARDVSKRRQASRRVPQSRAVVPAKTTAPTSGGRNKARTGTAVAAAPKTTSVAKQAEPIVVSQAKPKKGMINITPKAVATRPAAGRNAARTGSTKAAQTAARSKKLDNLKKMIAAAGIGTAGMLGASKLGDGTQAKAGPSTTKPKAKVTPPMPKPKDKDRKTPRKAEAPKAPKNTTSFTAGKNTGFGPKGNIFPGSAEERKALMVMYGGTGSKAGKAAIAGTQGNIAKGRSLLEAAKKKRLSKKTTNKKAGGKMVPSKYKGFSKLPEKVQKKMNPKKAAKYKKGGKVDSGCARQVKGFGAARRPPKK